MTKEPFYEHDKEKRLARNEDHAANPKVGDYWQEMLVGICVVVAVSDDYVAINKDKKQLKDGWRFKKKQTRMTRQEFKDWLSCSGKHKGYWADVAPEHFK